MKILFAITHLNFWAPLDPVARDLCASSDTVRLLLNKRMNKKFAGRYLMDPDQTPYEIGWMKLRLDVFQPILTWSREIISYASYLRLRKPTSPLLIERWAAYLPPFLRPLSRSENGRKWLGSDGLWNAMRRIEENAPPSRRILAELKEFKPDVVVVASAIMPYSQEIEYLKAARHLGIPVIVVIPSWDNLTTKGMLQLIPDWLFVWNERQVREAVDLHHIPETHIFCTGAPKFDLWFDLNPTTDRKSFCERIGMDPSKPYILYMCSSEFISGDETIFIDQLAEKLSRSPELRELNILVRPHPQNLKPWAGYSARNGNVFIWPGDLSIMDTAVTAQDFYHSIFHSAGVAGINTSAFIEAAIVDRPCIAIAADQFTYTQMGIPHFRHLLDAGFLELPGNVDEVIQTVSRLLTGEDRHRKKRRKFVRNFVRPQGIDIAALQIMSSAIKNIAQDKLPQDFVPAPIEVSS